MIVGKDNILDRLFSVAGKVAVVTGGSRGIGAMIAHGLLEAGARVCIVSRKAADCDETVKALSHYGDCYALPFDLSAMEEIEHFSKSFAAREKKLDILVNNAGAAWAAPFETYPESGWNKVVDLNLKSMFFLTQKMAPMLKAAANPDDPARVINIASINGLTNPHTDNYAYSASKAAIIHLTRHLAADLAKDHININAIAPGFFLTKMMSHAAEDDIVKLIPRGRPGQADDAAGAAIFLSSRASAWITGVTLTVDGGTIANA